MDPDGLLTLMDCLVGDPDGQAWMPIDDDVRPSWSDGWPNPRRIGASWWVHLTIPDRKDDQGTEEEEQQEGK